MGETRRRRSALTASLVLFLASPVVEERAAADTPPTRPAFLDTVCDLPGLTPDIFPRLRCGTVSVPRDRDDPGSGRFALAVVVIRNARQPAQPDPVVYVAGGPGSPLTSRAALLARHEAGVVAPDRDLILVDQRGAGRSEPALCPGLARRQLGIFAAGDDEERLIRAWRETYTACRQEIAAAGFRPEWFGTRITATDFETVREALGIERWNIYSLSYGTAVATTLTSLYPEHLRAVVLDSIFPPDPLPMTLAQSFGRAREMLFTVCRNDTGCATAHPDLTAAFESAVRGLDAEPLPVTLPPGLGAETMNLRSLLFRLVVNRALYSRAGMAALPAFMEAARDRRPLAIQDLIGRVVRDYADTSLGVMAAVECRERVSFRDATSADRSAPPVSAFVAGMCEGWSPLGPPPLLPMNTGVPSLLLAGTADPITPPAFARAAAAEMGERARVIEFPHVGHGAQVASSCGEALVSAFVRNPVGPLDSSCAARVAPVGFR